jgi:hypothetical protein
MCVAQAEAALDVLPAWKAAYEAKGKAAEEAVKAREREASARCDRLEALLDALQTRIWQRSALKLPAWRGVDLL